MTRQCGPEQLTPRELEVARLIGRGMTNREIGRALGIAEQTVKNHVSDALDRSGTRSRAALAVHVSRVDMLSSTDFRPAA
jgi:DNA-binding NarL/FixJ family response regulator